MSDQTNTDRNGNPIVGKILDIIDSGDSKRYEVAQRIAKHIEANYLPKSDVVAAIGKDQHEEGGYMSPIRNQLRREIRTKLGLDTKEQS